MEGCACSMVGALISQMHYVFTRKKVFWNYEISRVMAIDPKYNFPKGFSSVYYVNPLDLLKREEYDKIIILQRTKNFIIRDIVGRNKIKLDFQKYSKFFEKIDFYYDLIYNSEIEDKRIFQVSLENLTNYPVATYSDLFDFLGYPERGRPILIPLPIDPKDRNWKKRSSILRAGHEEGTIEKDDYSQFVNIEKTNPYKLCSEEYYYQKGMVYRIKPKPNIMIDTLEVLGFI